MHECVPDTPALVFGQHADWRQTQSGRAIDVPARAHDMADHDVLGDGDQ
jgi:hypothetical protein